MTTQDDLKRRAAERAVQEVEDGMVLGLGSGTTVRFVLEALAQRIKKGLKVSGIPTSLHTAELAKELGISITSFGEHRQIDLTIDGADEVERGTLNLIKGAGGALLREKIVASASKKLLIVVDESKLVDRLGEKTSLPVEISSFGWEATMAKLTDAGFAPLLRKKNGEIFVTDGGNYTVDFKMPANLDATAVEHKLQTLVGVLESGLFIGLSSQVILGGTRGISIF